MRAIETVDGPINLSPSDKRLMEVENALAFWYFYGRHPHRSLSGMPKFMITTADFRYVDGGRYWRFTREQTEDMLRALWPAEADGVLRRLQS